MKQLTKQEIIELIRNTLTNHNGKGHIHQSIEIIYELEKAGVLMLVEEESVQFANADRINSLASHIEKLAFSIPASNPYTPQFVQAAIEIKQELIKVFSRRANTPVYQCAKPLQELEEK